MNPMYPTLGLDVRDLLTIDVSAELRKLSRAQLQGAWQLPAELVRRAIRSRARNVQVTIGRQVVVVDDGAGLSPSLLGDTAVLLDSRRPTQERHGALVRLEEAGELAMLSLLGLDQLRDLRISSGFLASPCTLEFREKVGAVVRPGSDCAAGARITLQAGGLDARQAARWLTEVARFAPAAVVINGEKVPDAWEKKALLVVPLSAPLAGRVALMAEGETAHAHLLSDGLVSAQVTVPGAPSFEAAVEMGRPPGDLSAARLRDALTAHVPELVHQAAGLVAQAGSALASWPEEHRARVGRMILQAARGKLRPDEVERVPAFRAVTSAGPRLVDLRALRRASRSVEGAVLLALLPQQRPDKYLLGEDLVLVADEAERSLLSDLLAVRFAPPSRRQSGPSLAGLLRRLLSTAARSATTIWDLLRHPLRPQPIPDAALPLEDRQFLVALRQHLAAQPADLPRAVVMCQGAGPLRRQRGTPVTLLLPRDNPTVHACLRAYGADPGWLRVVALALTEGGRGGASSAAALRSR